MANGFLSSHTCCGEKQYDIWGTPDLKKGENILYFGEDTIEFQKLALQHFQKVTKSSDIRLYLIENYISNYCFFRLEGYKGDRGHP
jgi:hypothetical protein